MDAKTQRKLGVGFLTVLSAGFLFALGENPKLIDRLVNYPNPFDSRKESTFITYQLPQNLPVTVKIYDLFGYPVKEFNFMSGEMGAQAGENTIKWNGRDESGRRVSKGGYICQVTVRGEQPARSIRKIGVIH